MPATKQECNRSVSALSKTALNGKSVTDVIVTQHGATTVVEVKFSTGSDYIKVNGFKVEAGGDLNWGSGTVVF